MIDPKPGKKKKFIGFKVTPKIKTYQEGKSTADLSFKHGAEKRSYSHDSVETGHPDYGKAGGGTHSEMNSLLSKARAGKQDVTDHSSKGLTYKAGTTTISKKPDLVKTSVNIKPTLKMVVNEYKPQYSNVKAHGTPGRLKKMRVVVGGSDKRGDPANKTGIGSYKGVRITKTKSFPKH